MINGWFWVPEVQGGGGLLTHWVFFQGQTPKFCQVDLSTILGSLNGSF